MYLPAKFRCETGVWATGTGMLSAAGTRDTESSESRLLVL